MNDNWRMQGNVFIGDDYLWTSRWPMPLRNVGEWLKLLRLKPGQRVEVKADNFSRPVVGRFVERHGRTVTLSIPASEKSFIEAAEAN